MLNPSQISVNPTLKKNLQKSRNEAFLKSSESVPANSSTPKPITTNKIQGEDQGIGKD